MSDTRSRSGVVQVDAPGSTLDARRSVIWALGAVSVVALVLRLVGIQYGLPAVYNPDEVAIMTRALSFAKGTLNPGNFLYPTFYFYVLFGWVGVYLAAVWLTGGVSSLAALQELYFTNPVGIYTAGRLLTALCGTLSVVAVYRLGRELFNVQVGLACALFLAVSPLAVRDSHYVKHDVPVTLIIVLAHVAIIRIWPCIRTPNRAARDVIAAAAICGVAFSTHYYAIFLTFPLVWAIVQRWRGAGTRVVLRHLVAAAIVSTIVFFALSPFVLVEPITAMRDIIANRQIVIDRAVHDQPFAPLGRYMEMLWMDSMGGIVVAFGVAGATCMAFVAPARAVLLLLFPLSFLLFIANTAPASRYLNPMLPSIAILAAWMIDHLASTFRVSRVAAWIVILAAVLTPLRESVRVDQFFRTDDTRTVALRFVHDHVAAGATILIQPYSVSLTPSRDSLREALATNLGTVEAASTKFQIQLRIEPYPTPAYRLIWLGSGGLDSDKIYVDPARLSAADGVRELKRLGVTYVILKRYNNLDRELATFVTELSEHGRLIARFSPYRPEATQAERSRTEPFLHNTDTRIDDALERPGPPLEIWQLDDPS